MKKNSLVLKSVLLIVVITVSLFRVVPYVNKTIAAVKLDKYFDRVGISKEEMESIEYYSTPFFTVGLPDEGAKVVYKNEPDYTYTYSYCMTGNSFYPSISVRYNGRYLSPDEYKNLKNYTIGYEEYTAVD